MWGKSLVIIVCSALSQAGWRANRARHRLWDRRVLMSGILEARHRRSWLLPRLGINLGTGVVVTIVNATVGAILLLCRCGLRGGGGWGSKVEGAAGVGGCKRCPAALAG